MPKIDAEIGLRYLMGLWVLGTYDALLVHRFDARDSDDRFCWKILAGMECNCRSSGLGLSRSSDASCYINGMDLAAYNDKP
jgi:hypothetical protein